MLSFTNSGYDSQSNDLVFPLAPNFMVLHESFVLWPVQLPRLRCLATYALAIFVFSSSSLKVPENCFNRPWHWIWPQVSLQKVPHKSINTIKLMIILSEETTDFLFSLCPHTDLCFVFLMTFTSKSHRKKQQTCSVTSYSKVLWLVTIPV